MDEKCPICNKDLKKWYSSAGGESYIGCSDISCDYKKE